jgi:threonylcarbamoyladenosine tRNA methylthiotransferase MtaB
MSTVAFTTLGCKVNQYDTDGMRGLFFARGYDERPFDEKADIYVINTCSVTQVGEKKSRQLIRRAKKNNPLSIVVVTGCYAQLNPELLTAMNDVDIVIGTNEKHQVVDLVKEYAQQQGEHQVVKAVHDVMSYNRFEELPLYPSVVMHTRAHVKIQEGCHNFCTYCIIPYTRGNLKSRLVPDIIAEVNQLTAFGFKEIVLTGIHLGAYGMDLPDQPTLADVLEALLAETTVRRIRLGSIESVEVSEKLIHLMNHEERLCPHLHLPLQSGADAILQLMNRHYNKQKFIDLVTKLRREIPKLTVTTDIILGFPGETEELFTETMDTLRLLQFAHIHAFPYSKRGGTPAADFPDQVDDKVKKERVGMVNQLSKECEERLHHQLVGKKVQVLLEKIGEEWGEGFSEQYVRVRLSGKNQQTGDIISAFIENDEGDCLIGQPLPLKEDE